MKHILILYLLCLSALTIECQAQKKMDYILPENVKTEEAKKVFIETFKKGFTLYKMNCEKCHTTIVKRKKIIPDFSLPQLLDYEIRFAYPEHQESMKEVKISNQELKHILLFLQYKKRNNISKKK